MDQFPGLHPTVCVLWQSRSLTTHPVSLLRFSFIWIITVMFLFPFFILYKPFITSALVSVVSAFYAECLSKRIQFNAHIWTKSKFLGMSIGVHNIGQGMSVSIHSEILICTYIFVNLAKLMCLIDVLLLGCVSCLDHDEHYILTFPNGYGRCVLSMSVLNYCPVAAVYFTHLILCVQVDSDCAMGGARWGVQHLLLQVRLQR